MATNHRRASVNEDERLERYMEHAKSELVTKFPSVRRRMLDLPVCPKCERIALRDTRPGDPQRRYITCPVCGYHGPSTIAAKIFIRDHVV